MIPKSASTLIVPIAPRGHASRDAPRHKAILTAIQNRDALAARHASLVQLDDARNALTVVLGGV